MVIITGGQKAQPQANNSMISQHVNNNPNHVSVHAWTLLLYKNSIKVMFSFPAEFTIAPIVRLPQPHPHTQGYYSISVLFTRLQFTMSILKSTPFTECSPIYPATDNNLKEQRSPATNAMPYIYPFACNLLMAYMVCTRQRPEYTRLLSPVQEITCSPILVGTGTSNA